MTENTSKDIVLEDEKDLEKADEDLVELWRRRFKQAEDFRKPYDQRNLRMYKLYRAYRGWMGNYAYQTNLMPPIGFEVIETVKPRLAASKVNIRILPTKSEDINSPSLDKWDDLIEYYFDVMDFQNKKLDWIDAQLKYGNGTAQLIWEGEDPAIEICDNWLLYIDPQAKNRLQGTRWIIKRSWKEKEIIEKEEQERVKEEELAKKKEIKNRIENEEEIEDEDVDLSGEGARIYDKDKLQKLDNETIGDDPRREREEISSLKMGQIDDATNRGSATDRGSGDKKQKHQDYKAVELWECYDFIKQELVTIGNRKEVIRQEENPYKDIRKDRNPGNMFIDLPMTSLPWEYHAMPILEPIETIICEIADSRNQAMDNIIFNLDPIRKVRRNKGYRTEDMKTAPGATWLVDSADDIVVERPPEISSQWVEKDEVLRREIQTSLALSEYTQGMPQSAQEPMGKVELLLMQTNIRFSMLVRQLENAFEDMINTLIEMSQEFLPENKAMRIVGDDFRFEEFTEQDKKVYVDAKVEIIPKKEKTPEQETTEARELYEMFVKDQQPDGQDPIAMYKWQKKKAGMEKLLLERMGYDEYVDLLVDEPEKPQVQQEPQRAPQQAPQAGMEKELMGMVGQPDPSLEAQMPAMQQTIPEKEPMLPPEETLMPQATTGITQPSPGVLERLRNLIR